MLFRSWFKENGKILLQPDNQIPDEDWPNLDCMSLGILSYGHSFDSLIDFEACIDSNDSEFIIEVSESVTQMTNDMLFVPTGDGDAHSPIWVSIKLPESNTPRWKNASRPVEAKIRQARAREQKHQDPS